MPDKTETKPCLEDGTLNPADAATCSDCGGGSFQHALDQEVEHAAILAARAAGQDDPPARTPVDQLPASLEEAQVRFAAGWRPDGMCADCPSLDKPCRACWVRAGYSGEDYDASEAAAAREAAGTLLLAEGGAMIVPVPEATGAVVPSGLLPPLPDGAYGPDSLPLPHPDPGAVSAPDGDVAEDRLPPPPAVPVIASPPSDPNAPPGAHDGDDAGPTTEPEPGASVGPADPTSSGPSTVTTADETPKARGQRSSGKKGGGR